jgi:hypothetical protein
MNHISRNISIEKNVQFQSAGKNFLKTTIIVIYIRVRDVNFPARQLVSGTMAQPSA